MIDKLIPRLEYNEQILTGTISSGSPTITALADTDDLVTGMYITGVDIPAGTTVIGKTATTVTMSANATGSATESIAFFERFDFTYPPFKDEGEQEKNIEQVSKSLSGVEQVIVNYIEVTRPLEFNHITKTDRDTLNTRFFRNTAYLGREFRYFPDKADSSYETYTLATRQWKQKRTVKKHPDFLYQLSFNFRRVIDV
jgi:hypothetical protein